MQLRIGENAVVDGINKMWAGQNYGWQSKESYEELEQLGKLRWGAQKIDRIYQKLDNIGNELFNTLPEEAQQGIKTSNTAIADGAVTFIGDVAEGKYDAGVGGEELQPSRLLRDVGTVVRTIDDATEFVSEKTNISKDLIELAPDAIGLVATGGTGTALKKGAKVAGKLALDAADELIDAVPARRVLTPQIADGSLRLPDFNPITVDPGWRATPEVKEGVAGQVKGELTERRMRLAEIEANRVRQNAQGSKGANRRAKALTDRTASTLPDLAGDDPVAYGRRAFTEPDPDRPGFVMDQHHLFGKAQSAPFAQKIDELIAAGIADEDDLVALGEWGKKLGAVMGDRESNVLNAPKAIHVGEGGIHPTMRKAGLEPKTKDVQALLANAKHANDVMAAFNDYVLTYVKPSQKMAREMTENYLKQKSTFSKKEQTMMENFLADLRRRGA